MNEKDLADELALLAEIRGYDHCLAVLTKASNEAKERWLALQMRAKEASNG